VHRFAITAAPTAPMPSSRYTVRLGRGLLGLNLAGVIRSGTTRSGLSRCHAWTAGWASRISCRRADAEPTGATVGRGGAGGGGGGRGRSVTAVRLVSATTRPRSIVSMAVQRATALGRWLIVITV